MNATDFKYYVLQHGIDGKLYTVFGANNKREALSIANNYIDMGDQMTIVSNLALRISENLKEARTKVDDGIVICFMKINTPKRRKK